MDKQRTIRRTVLALALAALGATGSALAGDFANPQRLDVVSGGATVAGTITNGTEPDVHYYSFEGKAGDVITIDIDGTTAGGLDAYLALFRPDGTVAFESFETDPVDAGSNPPADCPDCLATTDPQLLSIRLDADGIWKIAVSAEPAYLLDQGVLEFTMANSSGSYTMLVSGLSAPAPAPTPGPAPSTQVNIDIKPRQAGPATIHPNSRGAIPVMLLSDSAFDPFTVDTASLRFGKTGSEYSYRLCAKEGWDMNRDGKPDRLCFFDTQRTGFKRGDTVGILKGITAGRWFEGKGDLKVVAEKRARYEKERQKHERKKHKRDRNNKRDKHDRDDDDD
jgi:hypothetical protein